MEINRAMQGNISSIRHALGLHVLKKSLGQDAQTMSALLDGMQKANSKTMEMSLTPHKGRNIDISV